MTKHNQIFTNYLITILTISNVALNNSSYANNGNTSNNGSAISDEFINFTNIASKYQVAKSIVVMRNLLL